jgi:uncharacterized repeat protein (TIGR01451 family)
MITRQNERWTRAVRLWVTAFVLLSFSVTLGTVPTFAAGGDSGGTRPTEPIAPHNINLSNTQIGIESSPGTFVGSLSTSDENGQWGQHVYSLVSTVDCSGADNDKFMLTDKNNYKLATRLTLEETRDYTICVRTTDPDGLTYEEQFTIVVTRESNRPPSGVTLRDNYVYEHDPAGTFAGYFTANDPDGNDNDGNFTYTLNDDCGNSSAGNNNFVIEGNKLYTTQPIDFESHWNENNRKSYTHICVDVTDDAGATYTQKWRSVTILDEDEEDQPDASGRMVRSRSQVDLEGYFINTGEEKNPQAMIFNVLVPEDGSGGYSPALCTDIKTPTYDNMLVTVDPDNPISCKVAALILDNPLDLQTINWADDQYRTFESGKDPRRTEAAREEMAALQAAVWYYADNWQITGPSDIAKQAKEMIESVKDVDCETASFPPNISIEPAYSYAMAPAEQEFVVNVTQGDEPIETRVELSSDFGTLSEEVVESGSTFTIQSAEAGVANIIATAPRVELPIATRLMAMSGGPDQQVMVLLPKGDKQPTYGTISTKAVAEWGEGTGEGQVVVHLFRDDNWDGKQNGDEPNLQSWPVMVFPSGGGQGMRGSSNEQGNAAFNSLDPNTYKAQVDTPDPEKWEQTTENNMTTIEAGGHGVINIGFVELKPAIRVFSFEDTNSSGVIPDDGDRMLEGSNVDIHPSVDGVTDKQTNAKGIAIFDNLTTEDAYTVRHTVMEDGLCTLGPSKQVVEGLGPTEVRDVYFPVGPCPEGALVVEAIPNVETVGSGDTVEYTVVIKNVGNDAVQNIKLANDIPDNMTFQPESATLDDSKMVDPAEMVVGETAMSGWDLTGMQLDPGDKMVVKFTVKVNNAETGQLYTYTASAFGEDANGDMIPADNSDKVPADTDPDDMDDAEVTGVSTAAWSEAATVFVAYEDLKEYDWNDWDYNDFVVKIDGRKQVRGDQLIVLELTYEAKAKGAGFSHSFMHQIPIAGGGSYQMTLNGQDITPDDNTFEEAADFTIFEDSQTVFGDVGEVKQINALPNQGYIPGDIVVLTIYLASPEDNVDSQYFTMEGEDMLFPWMPHIFVKETSVDIKMEGFGSDRAPVEGDEQEALISDPGIPEELVGVSLPLVQAFDELWKWPEEGKGIWLGYPDYIGIATGDVNANEDWVTNQRSQYIWSNAKQ